MEKLLNLCTKEMHFSFGGDLYQQVDGVAMDSPLGPVIANIFMVHLEQDLVPKLTNELASWDRYVDDTFSFVKRDKIDFVNNCLNNFHKDVQFTHEIEVDGKLPFLDILVERENNGSFSTSVYRKPTDTGLYINWHAFAPLSWKKGTLFGILKGLSFYAPPKRV